MSRQHLVAYRWFAVAFFGISLACAWPPLLWGQAAPGQASRAVLIIDGSGSMWGRLGQTTKIAMAQRALARVLPEIAPAVDLGLVSYGHRRKSNCSDIEVIARPGRNSTTALFEEVHNLSPRGKTPIASALEIAAEALDHRNQPGTIVLLSDGYENCRRDPCAMSSALRGDGAALTIHVIGLGLKPADRQRIKCISSEGGGTFQPVNAIDDLENALVTVFAGLGTVAPRSVEPPESTISKSIDPTGPPGLRLRALIEGSNRPILRGLNWKVTRVGGADTEPAVYEGSAPRPAIETAPGKYIVEARLGLANTRQTVDVAEQGPTIVTIPLNAGRLQLSTRANKGGPTLDNIFYKITVKPPGTSRAAKVLVVSQERTPEYHLAAGTYTISAQHGLARIERNVTIHPGRTEQLALTLNVGRLRLLAIAGSDDRVLDQMLFLVYEDDPDALGGAREVARSAADQPIFTLPAGSYRVVARRGRSETRARVTVQSGKTIAKRITLKSTTLRASAHVTGASNELDDLLTFRVYPDGASQEVEAKALVRTSRPNPTFHLEAGRYRIVGTLGYVNARASTSINLKPGDRKSIALEYNAGWTNFVLREPGGATIVDDVSWTLKDDAGRPLWSTDTPSPKTPLAAGSYELTAKHRGRRITTAFTLQVGQRKSIIVSFQ